VKYPLDKTLVAGDLEIGAVEVKNADTDARTKVATTGTIAEGDIAVAVQAPILGVTTGAALDTDGAGTIQQYLRGLLKAYLARTRLRLGTYTIVAPHAGGTQVTTLAAGGAGSDYWDLAANAEYELRCDPNWTGGQVDSDVIRGVFKLGGAPGSDDDGWYIRTGERAAICVAAISTLYVQAHNLGVAGRWTLRRVDG